MSRTPPCSRTSRVSKYPARLPRVADIQASPPESRILPRDDVLGFYVITRSAPFFRNFSRRPFLPELLTSRLLPRSPGFSPVMTYWASTSSRVRHRSSGILADVSSSTVAVGLTSPTSAYLAKLRPHDELRFSIFQSVHQLAHSDTLMHPAYPTATHAALLAYHTPSCLSRFPAVKGCQSRTWHNASNFLTEK